MRDKIIGFILVISLFFTAFSPLPPTLKRQDKINSKLYDTCRRIRTVIDKSQPLDRDGVRSVLSPRVNNIELFIFDFDRTLCDNERVEPSIIEQLTAINKKGKHLAIVTWNTSGNIQNKFEKYLPPGFDRNLLHIYTVTQSLDKSSPVIALIESLGLKGENVIVMGDRVSIPSILNLFSFFLAPDRRMLVLGALGFTFGQNNNLPQGWYSIKADRGPAGVGILLEVYLKLVK